MTENTLHITIPLDPNHRLQRGTRVTLTAALWNLRAQPLEVVDIDETDVHLEQRP
jgi:hypothetical protein